MSEPRPKKPSPPMAAVEILSAGAAGASLAALVLVALVRPVVGSEMECFPTLRAVLGVVLAIAVGGFLVALVVGSVLAVTVATKKAAPTFGSLGGLAGAVLAFALLSTPPFGDAIRYVFGMSSSHYGPRCTPDGWLGNNPELWKSFAKAMGCCPPPPRF